MLVSDQYFYSHRLAAVYENKGPSLLFVYFVTYTFINLWNDQLTNCEIHEILSGKDEPVVREIVIVYVSLGNWYRSRVG